MHAAKLLLVFCTTVVLGGCATLRDQLGSGEANSDVIASQQNLETETKLARMQTENARLANRVLELQREVEALRASAAEATSAAPADDPQPLETTVALRDQELVSRPVVVDNPETPEMTNTAAPVQPAPRLTQPTFGSTDAVFENEAVLAANAGDLFGVHLASYREEAEAREGWNKLQRDNPNELGLLEPRLETVEVPQRGSFLRLIGGGFSSSAKAEALCANLKQKGLYCTVADFTGKRLSLVEASG